MNYVVERGEERFGPYTLSELQEYVQSGNVLTGDMAKSDGMTAWVPVGEILGNIPMPVIAPVIAVPVGEQQRIVPLPPNLHWVILLILVVVTQQFFNFIWALVLANWARKLTNNNKPLVLVAMYPAAFLGIVMTGVLAGGGALSGDALTAVSTILILAGALSYTIGVFSIRSAMEEYYNSTEKIGLSMSGVMTFFFSSLYLQYHVNKIARWKKTGIYL
jgi:hypothetical protein